MLDWKEQLAEEQQKLVELRREFHAHPELGSREYRTAERIEEELELLGISHQRVGETGVLGTLRGERPGDGAVVLRADIDALPIQETNEVPYRSRTDGVMHACGHDAHTACLLGAAKLLADNRHCFGGEVRLVFQPGEEIGGGVKPFVEAGVLNGVRRVFGLHTAFDVPSGTVGLKPGLNNASVDHFKIVVQGRSTHVSTPQLGVDAVYIASQTVVALQALVTRRISPVEPVIIGVGKFHAGTTYNALAETAELEGTVRATSREMRTQVCQWVTQTAQRTAELYGGRAEVSWGDFASPLINDPRVCREAAEIAEQLGGRVVTDRELSMSGDNFADFILDCPGAYAYLGTGNPDKPHTLHTNHNGNFDIDEDALSLGAGLYAAYAMFALNEAKDLQ